MKVLHIIPTLGSGGAEKMLVDLIRESQEQNIECEVAVLSKHDNFFGPELEKLNITIHYGPFEKVYTINNIFFLRKLISKNSYDIVHTHLFSAQLFLPIAVKLGKKTMSIITTEHSTHNKRRDNKFFKVLDRWMYNQYNKIIAITADTKNNLEKYLPHLRPKILVIENGVDLNTYVQAKPINKKDLSNDLNKDEKLILMVAGMREQKDHETLIRASKLLPENYRVIFIGNGDRFEEVKNYAIQYGRDSILFLGTRKDVPSIMKTVDVFVLCSKWEGFGLVVVEAAAAGLPVITSNVEGMNEVVKTIGGQVFEPYNEGQLAEKIVQAIESDRPQNNISEFMIQKTTKKYIEIYNELLKG